MAIDDYQKCSRGELERDASILLDFVQGLLERDDLPTKVQEEAQHIISITNEPFVE